MAPGRSQLTHQTWALAETNVQWLDIAWGAGFCSTQCWLSPEPPLRDCLSFSTSKLECWIQPPACGSVRELHNTQREFGMLRSLLQNCRDLSGTCPVCASHCPCAVEYMAPHWLKGWRAVYTWELLLIQLCTPASSFRSKRKRRKIKWISVMYVNTYTQRKVL